MGWEGTTGFTGAGAGRALGSLTWLRGASFRREGWKAATLDRLGRANTMGSSGLAAGSKARLELSTSTTLSSGSRAGLGVALLPAPKKVKSLAEVVTTGAGASVVTMGWKVVTIGSDTVVAGAAVGLLPLIADSLGLNLFSLLGSLIPRKVSLVSLSDVCSISLISASWIWSLGLNLLAPFLLNSLNLGARVVVVAVVAAVVVVLTVGASVNTEKVCRVGTKAEERVVTSSATNMRSCD